MGTDDEHETDRHDASRTVHAEGHTRAEPPVTDRTGEFWTARQRQAHALHEVSYRACFKPQLPAFFIERLTAPGDVVYDPFMGRGTTPLQAALMGRGAVGSDINPLSAALVRPATNTLSPSAANRLQSCAPSPWSGPTPMTIAVPIRLSRALITSAVIYDYHHLNRRKLPIEPFTGK